MLVDLQSPFLTNNPVSVIGGDTLFICVLRKPDSSTVDSRKGTWRALDFSIRMLTSVFRPILIRGDFDDEVTTT